MSFEHVSVMADEIVQLAQSTPAKGVMIDATLGGAGHSKLLLESRDERLIAFDRDQEAIDASKDRLSQFQDRVEIIHSGFAEIGKEISKRNLQGEVSIVLFDLGVSSHQLDKKERGFTYRHEDAPLDMRMDSSQSLTAKQVVNEYSEEELAEIIQKYSDEKFAKQIAKQIIEHRPIENSGELVAAIRKAIPHKFQRLVHPAKRTFQALRMEVNKELDQLSTALHESVHLLAPGGRILVLSYHSGEDKIVKNVFKQYEKKIPMTPDGRVLPIEQAGEANTIQLVKVPAAKKPSKKEIRENPRAKSAKLRVVQKQYDQVSGL